jgi:hypothetical protein
MHKIKVLDHNQVKIYRLLRIMEVECTIVGLLCIRIVIYTVITPNKMSIRSSIDQNLALNTNTIQETFQLCQSCRAHKNKNKEIIKVYKVETVRNTIIWKNSQSYHIGVLQGISLF